MTRPIRLLIRPAAMTHNLERVIDLLTDASRQCPGGGRSRPSVWAVIKADAYGHGIERAVKAFSRADGLAMLDYSEAVRARSAGWQKPILMLEGLFEVQDVRTCLQWDLCPVIHESGQIGWIDEYASGFSASKPLDVYLKLDTGMHRLGFTPPDYGGAFKQLVALRGKHIVGRISHMTHFACADEPSGIDAPMEIFQATVGDLAGDYCVANSAAVLAHTRKILDSSSLATSGQDARHWVRPGICLYGASPLADRTAQQLGLLPSMTLQSRVLAVRSIKAGEGVGYSYLYRAERDMRVAVVACGYADGYPRHAPSGTPVFVKGQLAKLAGRVSMDMLMVDITDLPDVKVGDEVVLWGEGGPSIDEVARASQTIGYELMTAVTQRVPRIELESLIFDRAG